MAAVATLKAAISNANSTRLPCIRTSPTRAAADKTRLSVDSTVGNEYSCRPVKAAENAPKGNPNATDNPTPRTPSRTLRTRARGIW